MIVGYSSGGLLVHVISNVPMSIVITCITMGVFGTTPNGLVQLLSHLLWVMFSLLDPLLSVGYVVSHMCTLLCIILKYYIFISHMLECPALAFILVYMIILWLMVHTVNHWTWHTSALQTKY